MSRAGRAVAGLIAVAIGLITLGWVFANPPEASPDEPAALVKALATGRLDMRGAPFTSDLPPYDTSALGRAWVAKAARAYRLPARQAPAGLRACMAFRPSVTGRCLAATPHPHAGTVLAATQDGVYPPFLYLPMGVAARFATGPDGAYYLARLASALCSIALLAGAAWCACTGRRTWWPAAGLALAVTPMALFLAASVNTNGMEVAGAICFWAALTRVLRSDAPGPVWILLGLGGATMALARQLDDGWLLAGAVVFLCVAGRHEGLRSLRAGGRAAAAGVGMASAAGVASLAWDLLLSPSPPMSLSVARRNAPTVKGVEALAHQSVGVFGWLDTPLPAIAERAWLGGLALLVVAALVVGSRRHRLAIVASLAALVGGTVAMQTLVLAQIGYGMQARYVLAMAVALPLVCAEVMDQRRSHLPAMLRHGAWPMAFVVATAVVQWVAFRTNAVRNGVGVGSAASLTSPGAWQPRGGALIWQIVAGTGAACLCTGGLLMSLTAPGRATTRP